MAPLPQEHPVAHDYGRPFHEAGRNAGASACDRRGIDAIAPASRKRDGDEDCLVLNVYTRKTGPEAGATRPVMVWLHGGGFSYGQAANNVYRGHNLAKNHDVVFVGEQHRHAVGGLHHAGRVRTPADGCVGLGPIVARVGVHDARAVHLLQPRGAHRQLRVGFAARGEQRAHARWRRPVGLNHAAGPRAAA
jgi:hypothetical protein